MGSLEEARALQASFSKTKSPRKRGPRGNSTRGNRGSGYRGHGAPRGSYTQPSFSRPAWNGTAAAPNTRNAQTSYGQERTDPVLPRVNPFLPRENPVAPPNPTPFARQESHQKRFEPGGGYGAEAPVKRIKNGPFPATFGQPPASQQHSQSQQYMYSTRKENNHPTGGVSPARSLLDEADEASVISQPALQPIGESKAQQPSAPDATMSDAPQVSRKGLSSSRWNSKNPEFFGDATSDDKPRRVPGPPGQVVSSGISQGHGLANSRWNQPGQQ